MERLEIRKYRPEDWPRLTAIHDSARKRELALAGLDAAFVPLAEAAEREGLFDYTVDVVNVGGEVQGFVAYSEDELAWLYVDPARTGEGLGRALVSHALKSIKSRPLYVEVLQGNEPVIGLYRSEGFTELGLFTGKMPGNETFEVSAYRMRLE